MKHLLTLALAFVFVFAASAQTIRIANNNPGATGGTNVFTGATALQNAINASSSGDIIQVIPGTISHGDINITDKSITILGIGLNPQKGVGTRSLVDDIYINGNASSGTRLSGLHFGRFLLAQDNTPVHSISNLLVENCQLDAITQFNNSNSIGNLIVRNCVINTFPGFSSSPGVELYVTSGVLITNCIFRASSTSACTLSGNGLTIQNNLFYGSGTASYVFINTDNCIVQNNLFVRVSGSMSNVLNTGNAFYNNLVFGSTDNTFTNGPGGNSSTGGIVADPKITNIPSTNTAWVYTSDITLQAGSPAINAGLDGTNIGPTGGTTPFDTEGTLLPLIESINMPAVVTKGEDLKVNIKAKGN